MIIVLGEVMLDKYTYGKVERINPEAPVPILNVVEERYTLGGAGNVANNVASLKHDVFLISIINNDEFGKCIEDLCNKNNIKYCFISDGRPIIVKHRFVAMGYNQQLLRVDYEKIRPIDDSLAEKILEVIKKLNGEADILIISDYAKGVITKKLMDNIKKTFKGKILVDPKPKNIEFYKGVYLIKPNLKEASQIVGREIENKAKWDCTKILVEALKIAQKIRNGDSRIVALLDIADNYLQIERKKVIHLLSRTIALARRIKNADIKLLSLVRIAIKYAELLPDTDINFINFELNYGYYN